MHEKKYATLRNIARWWNIMGLGSSRVSPRELTEKLLPDIMNERLVSSSQLIDLRKPEYYTKLVDGSYHDRFEPYGSNQFANSKALDNLRIAIAVNLPMEYLENSGYMGCRDNMLYKLRCLVSQTDLNKIQNVSKELLLLPFEAKNAKEFNAISMAISRLCDYKTLETCTYAMFLLILSSVFRDRMMGLGELYSNDRITTVIKEGIKEKLILPDGHEILTDKNYINKAYRVYLYRSSMWDKEHLYSDGLLTLDTTATLQINDIYQYGNGKKGDPVSLLFRGVPIIANSVVYIVMNDLKRRNSPGILMFTYSEFDNGEPLYFRLGLFLSVEEGNPHVQRIVIVRDDVRLDEATEITIRGLLRTSGKQIFLSSAEIEAFKSKFSDASWMNAFKHSFETTILGSAFEQCVIDENAILGHVSDHLSKEDLVQIAFSLKNFSDSKWPGKDTHVDCKAPEHFHRLVR